ncbi:Mbeg1-like protein [Vibrio astriarenae]
MKRILIIIAVTAIISGCGIFPKNWFKEEGYVWCNARYLDLTSEPYKPYGSATRADKRINLAMKGYVYALLGAVELQKKGESDDKHFNLPPYIEFLESRNDGGFQASSFKVYTSDDKTELYEVVVVYRGTDEIIDWTRHNLSLTPEQYKPAREFLIHTANKFPDERIVVTGYSLGGGLAIHVLANEETTGLVSEAWAFNTSPRTGESSKKDKRLYVLGVKGEALGTARAAKKGLASLGAVPEHYEVGYDLINASSIYLHARYVLARQVLIFADMGYYEEAGRQENYVSPPLRILKLAELPQGCDGSYKEKLVKAGRL